MCREDFISLGCELREVRLWKLVSPDFPREAFTRNIPISPIKYTKLRSNTSHPHYIYRRWPIGYYFFFYIHHKTNSTPPHMDHIPCSATPRSVLGYDTRHKAPPACSEWYMRALPSWIQAVDVYKEWTGIRMNLGF